MTPNSLSPHPPRSLRRLVLVGPITVVVLLAAIAVNCSDPTTPQFANPHDARSAAYIPGVPTNLRVASSLESSRTILWQRNSVAETKFRIERRLGPGGEYLRIADVPAGTTSYNDTTTILTDTVYTYRIAALAANGHWSNFDSTRFLFTFAVPFSLHMVSKAPDNVRLAWSDTSKIATGFIIEQRTRTTGFIEIARTISDSLACTVNGLDTNSDYQYRVSGYTATNRSRPGDTVSAIYMPVVGPPSLAIELGYPGAFLYGGTVLNPRSWISPDGSLGLARGDGQLTLMNIITHAPVWTTSTLFVSDCAFSADNAYMATASSDRCIRITRLSDGVVTRSYQLVAPVNVFSLGLSGDGSRLLHAADAKFWVYDNTTGWPLLETPYMESFSRLPSISPDGTTVACIPGIWAVELWDVASGKLKRRIPTTGKAYFASFGPNSLVAVGWDGGLSFWNYRTGTQISSMSGRLVATNANGAFDPEGLRFFYEYDDISTLKVAGIGVVRVADCRFLELIPPESSDVGTQCISITDCFGQHRSLERVDGQNKVFTRTLTNCWVQQDW